MSNAQELKFFWLDVFTKYVIRSSMFFLANFLEFFWRSKKKVWLCRVYFIERKIQTQLHNTNVITVVVFFDNYLRRKTLTFQIRNWNQAFTKNVSRIVKIVLRYSISISYLLRYYIKQTITCVTLGDARREDC